MIPWWVAVITLFVGGLIGMVLMACVAINGRDDRP